MFENYKDPNCHVHNHAPSLDPSAHTSHRKMTIPVKGMVQRLSAYTAIRAREINAVTQGDYLRIVFYGQGYQERETAG
jgi:hypothetical protein